MTAPSTTKAAPQALTPSALETDVLRELNLMRSNPKAYGAILRTWSGRYNGKILHAPSQARAIQTLEGEAALVEAIAAVEAAPKLQTMGWLDALSLAANDHVKTQGATRTIGHKGEDGSNSLQRISRHGRSRGRSAEIIDYGWKDARSIVIDLLVDDGIADRGHRRAMLDPLYATAGVSCGNHARYGVMCVVEMAERFDAFPVTAPTAPPVTIAAAR